jgi:tetratricopeptide (TPR) repeat protein
MKRTIIVGLFLVGLGFNQANAQTVESAKKLFVYEKFASAKAELQKIIAATPNNADANYWLVQTLLQLNDRAGARAAANAGLAATNNSPLMQVAQGSVDLFEDNKAGAKIKFESAITASDKKSLASIYNAIGKAHGSVGFSQSEPDYAIEKLNLALQKEPKNAEILINIGDCYRRKLDGGGNAVSNYMKANVLDPNNALAYYRQGQIYQTQDNCGPMEQNYLMATQKDPNFMPAWRELYDVYVSKESQCYSLDKAKNYLDKYTATAEQGIDLDKIKMKFCYSNNDYACAIAETNKIIEKYGETADIDLLRYKAYILRDMGDSINANAAFDNYFAKQDPAKVGYRVYIRAAEVAMKVAGSEAKAIELYNKSINAQPDSKLNVPAMSAIANYYYKAKDYANAANWFKKLIDISEKPSSTNLFYATVAYYNASNYTEGAKMGDMYAEKYPADYRGSLWSARNNAQLDTTFTLGLAVPSYEKCVTVAETDIVKNKAPLVEATKYLTAYYGGTKNDKIIAKTYLDKLKLVDSTNASIPELESLITNGKAAPKVKTPTTPTPSTGTPKTTVPPATKPVVKPTTTKPGTVAVIKPVAKPAVVKPAPKVAVKTPPVKKNSNS